MLIYKIENIINGKLYIGKTEQTIEIRYKKHLREVEKHTNRYLYDAMNHYGVENFKISEIEKCSSKEELCEREKYWIKFYDSINKENGYNMVEGGLGGKQPDEVRKRAGYKISKVNKGRIVSKETRDKISKSHIGLKHSKETKRKLSNIVKKQKNKTNIKDWSTGRFNELSPQYKKIDIDKVKELIYNRYSCKKICKELNISNPTLWNKFKKSEGISILEYKRLHNIKRRNDA